MTTHLTSVLTRAARTARRAQAESRRIGRVALAAVLLLLACPPQALLALTPSSGADAATMSAVATRALTAAQQAPGSEVLDYTGPFNSTTIPRLKAAKAGVVIRYVGSSKWKCLTRAEADALRGAGIDVAAVYETNADWMLAGRAAGVAAAKKARAAVVKCGGPRSAFVYFACDVDTSRYSAVNACLKGAASVLGANRVGIYGSYSVCDNALKSGYATKAWQTEAWSGGRVLPQTTLYQSAHKAHGAMGGLNYDSNFSRDDDVGQWGYGGPGSVTWTAQSSPTSATLSSVDFANDSAGWAVGATGTVLHTGDGGATWAPQSTPTTAALAAVDFPSTTAGWAVGEAGTVLRTADGASWASQSTPSTAALAAVSFTDSTTGWAVGAQGTVLHTGDGATWASQPTSTTATLTAVDFASGMTGWAVGEAGTVLRTTNGGAGWTTQSAPTTATLMGVRFIDTTTGWTVGEGGTVLHTINAGKTWTAQSTPTSATLTSIDFVDDVKGWAVGDTGTVICTTDGGKTWSAQTAPATAKLTAVDFTSGSAGWAVGEGGTMLRAAGAGMSPFGAVVGVVTNVATGKPVSGVGVKIGTRPSAPSAVDGTFIAARIVPGTYAVAFSDPRYIAETEQGVVVSAGLRTTVKERLTARIATALTKPVVELAPQGGQVSTLSVTLSPSAAATAAATTITGWHYESKTVVKKVKKKSKKVKVWYWRQRFRSTMTVGASGRMVRRTALAAGKWRAYASFAGSGTFLRSTSATARFTVQ